MNDESKGTCSVNRQIKFKNIILRSSLCDYGNAHILVKGIVTITGARADAAARQADERFKEVIFKKCVSFINFKIEINNTETDNAIDIDIVMPMYNLIEYSDNYSKTSGSLWQYYKDAPNDNLTNSKSFKYKIKIAGKTPDDGNTKNAEINVLLKCFKNFCRRSK